MKYVKKNNRLPYRSNKRSPYSKNGSSLSNNKNRPKGNVSQLIYKYSSLAKESSSTGDHIQAEYYYQMVDHYNRVLIENGSFQNSNTSSQNDISEKENISLNEDNEISKLDNNDNEKENEKNLEIENNNKTESIESVSFIANPVKKQNKKKTL